MSVIRQTAQERYDFGMDRWGQLAILAAICALIGGCGHSDLRGSWSNSKDGYTYLIVADNDCENCPLVVDGKPWRYKVGEAGRVDPGLHKLGENGGEITFNVPARTVYRFTYWGP